MLATDTTQTALSIAALALMMASAPVIFASYVFAQQPNATMSSCPPAMNATTAANATEAANQTAAQNQTLAVLPTPGAAGGANTTEAQLGQLANETTNQTTGAEQFARGAANATTAANATAMNATTAAC